MVARGGHLQTGFLIKGGAGLGGFGEVAHLQVGKVASVLSMLRSHSHEGALILERDSEMIGG